MRERELQVDVDENGIVRTFCEELTYTLSYQQRGGVATESSKNKLDEYSELALDAIARYPESNIKQACKDLVAFNKNRVK